MSHPLRWLLLAAPVALGLRLAGAAGVLVFAAAGLAIVPLAGLLGEATEELADSLGAAVGGLLNATFGNAAELIIALAAIAKGPAMYPLVKASITGSIIGNILLVLGAAILAGGLRHRRQEFNRTSASMAATLLALAAIGLVVPTLFERIYRGSTGVTAAEASELGLLSGEIALVLASIYLLSLVFSLVTHRELFAEAEGVATARKPRARHGRRRQVAVLVGATAGVAVMSELLVGSVEQAGEALHMNQIFIGVIVVAIVGNAAEHSTAVLMALRNRMDLAMHIAVGSGIQIALFVAPLLVFASWLYGNQPILDLHFSLLELAAVLLSVGVLALVSQDGESHWMEGVMLLGVYLIFAIAFYHLPATAG